MRTHRLGAVDLELPKIAADLRTFVTLPLSTAYSDYLCGGPWLSCAVWGPPTVTDGLIEHAGEAPSGWTAAAEQLPAVRALIQREFQLAKLRFARLAMVSAGSVIIPHRDLLELSAPLHRFHVPLRTDGGSVFAEDRHVFHMAQGELWALDAANVHSVSCSSAEPRIHLILDYADDAGPDEMSRLAPSPSSGIPPAARVDRPPLTPAQQASLSALATVLSLDNHRTIIELVTRQFYASDVGLDFVWATLRDIADRAPDQRGAARLRELEDYFLLRRETGRAPVAAAAT